MIFVSDASVIDSLVSASDIGSPCRTASAFRILFGAVPPFAISFVGRRRLHIRDISKNENLIALFATIKRLAIFGECAVINTPARPRIMASGINSVGALRAKSAAVSRARRH
jgi:hypothetical protein